MTEPTCTMTEVVEIGPVEIGPVAHGGHCVARHEGRVVFVRHALPGERVLVRLTDTSRKSFWRGDAVEVLQASPDRTEPPCPVAVPGGCGGCDFQHVSLAGQRRLKGDVVREQLGHLAGIDWTGEVEAVEPFTGWRTRTRFLIEAVEGREAVVGMRAHRSHDLVPLPADGCLIAHPGTPTPDQLARVATQSGVDELRVVVPDDGQPRTIASREQGAELVPEVVGEHHFRVRADGFWQVHPRAAETLTDAVLEMLRPAPGEHALDLYCGVGLFAGALAGRGCRVVGVEQVQAAVRQARRNVPRARFIAAPLARALRQLPPRVDLIVLDPPRTGAGAQVVRHLAGLQARAIAYVACDPAALGRDLASFAELGYHAERIRAFDLFPMTHHVECVALLTRS
ncbi:MULTISPECIES: class I SAM-dependent RNA methyltransferase [unclassified Luteococcus]|uniref:class I SAM-dependent RNA methyltransferase n=1 Tax=unclassified Luteococcus TaxID=2639923 RepID=UPI00313D6795